MNNGDINTEQDVEAPLVIRTINERGIIIHSTLADYNGKVDIAGDNVPAPENIPSFPLDEKTGNIFFINWGHGIVCSRYQV